VKREHHKICFILVCLVLIKMTVYV